VTTIISKVAYFTLLGIVIQGVSTGFHISDFIGQKTKLNVSHGKNPGVRSEAVTSRVSLRKIKIKIAGMRRNYSQ
jgi:hypothetical protein